MSHGQKIETQMTKSCS